MFRKIVILIAIAVGTSGCISHNVKKGFSFTESSGTGLAVFTVTHDKIPAFGATYASYILYSPHEKKPTNMGSLPAPSVH